MQCTLQKSVCVGYKFRRELFHRPLTEDGIVSVIARNSLFLANFMKATTAPVKEKASPN
jgi:hypothetical protein